jgi:hypothetical protein
VNFDASVEIDGTRVNLTQVNPAEVRSIPWCGLLIDMHTLVHSVTDTPTVMNDE